MEPSPPFQVTMSTSKSFTNDWAQFYSPTAVDSTAVSTGPTQPEPVPNIEDRVGKTGRRRTRASRRAPTTLLNTDPTNFRAMVQQFTGAPAGPYVNQNGPVINFGYRSNSVQAPAGQYQQLQQSQGQAYSMEGGGYCQGGVGNNGFVQGFNFDANDTTFSSGPRFPGWA